MHAVLHVPVFYMQLYCFGMGNQLLLLYMDAPFSTALLFLEVHTFMHACIHAHIHAMGVGKRGLQEPGPPWFLAIAGQSRPGLASLQQELFLQYPHITSNLTLMLYVLSSLVYLK